MPCGVKRNKKTQPLRRRSPKPKMNGPDRDSDGPRAAGLTNPRPCRSSSVSAVHSVREGSPQMTHAPGN